MLKFLLVGGWNWKLPSISKKELDKLVSCGKYIVTCRAAAICTWHRWSDQLCTSIGTTVVGSPCQKIKHFDQHPMDDTYFWVSNFSMHPPVIKHGDGKGIIYICIYIYMWFSNFPLNTLIQFRHFPASHVWFPEGKSLLSYGFPMVFLWFSATKLRPASPSRGHGWGRLQGCWRWQLVDSPGYLATDATPAGGTISWWMRFFFGGLYKWFPVVMDCHGFGENIWR